ncbi:MAG: C40 family peptidase [Propionibacteriales bacterium]|nr:C40 family peptidase [Propionibacteriales bacterium]
MALRTQVISSTLSDYQNAAGLSTATSFIVANDPHTFMTQLADAAVADSRQTDVLTQLTRSQDQLSIQQEQAQVELDAVRDVKAKIAAHTSNLAAKTQQAQDLLESLEARQRARLLALQRRQEQQAQRLAAQRSAERGALTTNEPRRPAQDSEPSQPSRDNVRAPTQSVATSDRAQVAVDTALAQIGDPYVYGAAGPDAFDCSGLTMYAWAAAGVSISHASSMQPGEGTPVPVSDLMPGDLVFYYSPISHVGMYIGNGQIVHAPHPGSSVEIVPLDLMPIATAVRIG